MRGIQVLGADSTVEETARFRQALQQPRSRAPRPSQQPPQRRLVAGEPVRQDDVEELFEHPVNKVAISKAQIVKD